MEIDRKKLKNNIDTQFKILNNLKNTLKLMDI